MIFRFASGATASAEWTRRGVVSLCIVGGVVCGVFALGGCSDKTRWRSATDATGKYSADFPDAPQMEIDKIVLDETHQVGMRTQTATNKNGVTYAVGAMILPEDSDAMRRLAQRALLDGMARNVAHAVAPAPVSMTAADGTVLSGESWQSTDTVPGTRQSRVVRAQFVSRGDRVYEVVIVGEHLPSDQDQQRFFNAFKPF
ncbi:hypothetical protein [Robbsia andropogonis]|uniref:hypothetical protein n=1 Tax=Robbsia andropogonis TaxID=28092 RepID=UPI0020A114D4|nr:hypothetical protein [Robbsia andropogonis]MCP1117211.1 hypothetical protein [Robbsia andropogonis]MCP1128557.1 hypothetical protein [Robbsia andropogonis]